MIEHAGAGLEPFLKWAGGKRWLARLNVLPISENHRLIEPFMGGAAVFFHVKPKLALLSDINAEIVNLYRVIRDDVEGFVSQIEALKDHVSEESYYKLRSSKPASNVEKAARTLYLNRLCWNGLYRVNRRGEFNVPKGTKESIILSNDDFVRVSSMLKNVELLCSDFESVIDRSGEGDFVFVDPPYTVKHNMNGFVKYNESIFSWSDQIRLRDSCMRANERGAIVAITNADHDSLHDLYRGIAEYVKMNRASVLAGNSSFRGRTSEALFFLKG